MGQTQTQRRRASAGTFAEKAADLSPVRSAETDLERFPPRVAVEVNASSIPPGLRDLLDAYDADVRDVTWDGAGLRLEVAVPDPWKDGGVRTVRKQGGSLLFNIPPEALDASGIGEEKVAVHAREGELHVKRQEGEGRAEP
ncbi:hypothetical protein M197_gp17 [Haloarcula hispanica tailed virus 2]|uniref:Uncharacterized protein n=1 Tax=Haloarcula hispanica tailed virus 2 TaxID=1273751 RepID=R4TKI3_9CAUD|nr:hypothetical protein M197_gp17 [Haloarcula hispanica tailed virus 2]AGM11182.1 hypothetical protein HHTV2_17 [Haloarcula hispanica tailed virus 2]